MGGSWKTEALQQYSSTEPLRPVWNPRLFPFHNSGEILLQGPCGLNLKTPASVLWKGRWL